GARQPGGSAAMQVGISGPTGRAELSGAGDGPQLPLLLPSHGIESGKKSAHTRISAGTAHNDCVFHHQRSAGSAIMLDLVGELNVPNQVSGTRIEAQEVSIIGFG